MDSIIKIDGTLVAEASKLLKELGITGFVSAILGVPTDHIEKWRSDNLVKWYSKYQKARKDLGSQGHPIPPKFLLIPALRAIVDEDDEDMQGLWARLVAGFDQPRNDQRSSKVFIGILSAMTSNDGKLLLHLLSRPLIRRPYPEGLPGETVKQEELSCEQAAAALGLSSKDVAIAAGNLTRLGCCRTLPRLQFLATEHHDGGEPFGGVLTSPQEEFYPTTLGVALVEALSGVVARHA